MVCRDWSALFGGWERWWLKFTSRDLDEEMQSELYCYYREWLNFCLKGKLILLCSLYIMYLHNIHKACLFQCRHPAELATAGSVCMAHGSLTSLIWGTFPAMTLNIKTAPDILNICTVQYFAYSLCLLESLCDHN